MVGSNTFPKKIRKSKKYFEKYLEVSIFIYIFASEFINYFVTGLIVLCFSLVHVSCTRFLN